MENGWISYIDRSYQQIKTAVLEKVSQNIPEMTDHTESNLFIKMVSIWSAITEMIGYYIDNTARETHVSTARLYSSMIKHSFANDYRPHAKVSASVNLTFTLNEAHTSDITIPAGTVVSTDNNVEFYTKETGVILAGATTGIVGAVQGNLVYNVPLANSDGSANQEFILSELNVADRSVVLRVNAVAWTFQESMAYSNFDDEVFTQTVNSDKQVILKVGDNFNGLVPPNGSIMLVDYVVTAGAGGNVVEGSLTTLITSVSLPSGKSLTVTNTERASGGSDVQSLESIRNSIPKNRRTLQRAVTRRDYGDVVELLSGVSRAGVYFECGKFIDLFIVPEGGGIASQVLIDAAQNFINDRKMVTTKVIVKSAGEVRVLLEIDVTVKPQYQQLAVNNDLKNRLAEFISYQNQSIGGEVQLSDVYEVIENTTGVRHSSIKKMVAKPYARPINATTALLVWERVVLEASDSTIKWRIQMISATQFQLFRDNNFLGVFNVGVSVPTTQLIFVITANSYVLGDEWTFVTYPYFGTVILDEPSIPVTLVEDIILTITGGL